jgi:hypothetical protein
MAENRTMQVTRVAVFLVQAIKLFKPPVNHLVYLPCNFLHPRIRSREENIGISKHGIASIFAIRILHLASS